MRIIRYDGILSVAEAIQDDEPLFAVILFDGSEAVVSHADEAGEHYILLRKAGRSGADIDKYFRIVFDERGADWTFICPPDYRGITDKIRRIASFYKDGFDIISKFLQAFGYTEAAKGINIPKRYQRHMKMLGE